MSFQIKDGDFPQLFCLLEGMGQHPYSQSAHPLAHNFGLKARLPGCWSILLAYLTWINTAYGVNGMYMIFNGTMSGIIQIPQFPDLPHPGWYALALATWRGNHCEWWWFTLRRFSYTYIIHTILHKITQQIRSVMYLLVGYQVFSIL